MSPEPPAGARRDFSLARLTTVRTGGPADWFARPRTEGELTELLARAAAEGLAVGVVGSGSNLLVADDGFRGLVIKLDGPLAEIEREDDHLICGGGARLPAAATRAAGWGLTGLEFGVNIPGTVGGAVRMNANAYGGQLGKVLEWVDVCTAAGRDRRGPDQLGFSSGTRTSGPGGCRPCLLPSRLRPAGGDKATMARMRERRHEAQPSGIKTFGSTFKNPSGRGRGGTHRRAAPQGRRLPGPAGRRGPFLGQARNFVENLEGATTADVLELMAEGRRRVHESLASSSSPRSSSSARFAGRRAGGCGAAPAGRRGSAVVVVAAYGLLLR